MGIYLSSPKKEKFSEDGENERFKYGVSAMQGWRRSMEDAHAAILDLDDSTSFFGVYDGHGVRAASKFCAKHLHNQVLRSEAYNKGDVTESLQKSFLRMDEMMKGHRGRKELAMLNGGKISKINTFFEGLRSPRGSGNKGFSAARDSDDEWVLEQVPEKYAGPTFGSTAVVALLQQDKIVVANAGDSQCVLSRGRKAYDLSWDHKPEVENERERIMQAGGFIHCGRVNGSLNLARAIGYVKFKQNEHLTPEKQMVTAWPDVEIVQRTADDEFLILACDGVWDVMSSQEVVDFIHDNIQEATRLSSVCEKLLNSCLAPTTEGCDGQGCDNMTIIIVQIQNQGSQFGICVLPAK